MSPREAAVGGYLASGRQESRLSLMFRTAVAAELGLTVTDMECLDFLIESGSATAGQLAEQTGLTTGAITSMIRRLQNAGYLRAERDPDDRRRVIVTPEPEALQQGAELYAPFGEQVAELVGAYSEEELAFLTRHQQAMGEIYTAQLERLR
ncbi:MarR family transcriptional regulator [Glycomyces luteolus]|uniref:MarR family transcriptional regulator n=1 Tax=Glycomyces luteolus TaxID=2670330 RepID=A0A9X3PHK0_9ACTN|nr:MarR family transcriptional regulator [Glycomyces luteolus]MDA1358670.1 MarR family transcriptional regulator [Glycomyces luteolus]